MNCLLNKENSSFAPVMTHYKWVSKNPSQFEISLANFQSILKFSNFRHQIAKKMNCDWAEIFSECSLHNTRLILSKLIGSIGITNWLKWHRIYRDNFSPTKIVKWKSHIDLLISHVESIAPRRSCLFWESYYRIESARCAPPYVSFKPVRLNRDGRWGTKQSSKLWQLKPK